MGGPAIEAAESDPWVEALRRALVPITGGAAPLPEEQRAQAAKAAERAMKEMGTGIDPAAILQTLDRLAAVLQTDPTCVPAYLGAGRIVQLLAAKRPGRADEMHTLALEWLNAATTRVGNVQSSGEVHELEARLRSLRADVRARPKATAAEVDVVRLERDREGRAKPTRPPPRFRPPSEMLRALLTPAVEEGTGRLLLGREVIVRAVLVVGAVGLVLALVTWFGLRGDDRSTAPAWSDPTLGSRVQEALGLARPLLEVDAPLRGEPPGPAAVVADTGAGRPGLPDPLQAVLPAATIATTGAALRSLVVVRRYEGPDGHLLLAWIVDLEQPPRVVSRATFTSRDPSEVARRAHTWLAELGWR